MIRAAITVSIRAAEDTAVDVVLYGLAIFGGVFALAALIVWMLRPFIDGGQR